MTSLKLHWKMIQVDILTYPYKKKRQKRSRTKLCTDRNIIIINHKRTKEIPSIYLWMGH